jgi:hypothetical protein
LLFCEIEQRFWLVLIVFAAIACLAAYLGLVYLVSLVSPLCSRKASLLALGMIGLFFGYVVLSPPDLPLGKLWDVLSFDSGAAGIIIIAGGFM